MESDCERQEDNCLNLDFSLIFLIILKIFSFRLISTIRSK